MSTRRRKFYGWGYADEGATPEEVRLLEKALAARFGIRSFDVTPAPRAEEITLRAPRLEVPAALKDMVSTGHLDRLEHCYGQMFVDVARMFARSCPNPPDAIAFPRNEQEVTGALAWCDEVGAVAIPYGGGPSVVAGVEPPQADRIVSIDLRHLDRVLEVDPVSQAARIQGGVLGKELEAQLKPAGFTLRHYMQSFELSSLGGWIATRSGGHYATLYTHIDDQVESLRVVTPAGTLESRRLPGSGAGPSPDRMFIGSEGILGIITEAWMRVRKRPSFRASTTVRFKDFYAGADAVRAISQAGLYPANCRLLQAEEAAYTGPADKDAAVVVLSFESADHPVDAWMKRALELAAEHGGRWDAEALASQGSHRAGAAGEWREKFVRMPYLTEHLVARGIAATTFESAITWDRFKDFHSNVMDATRKAIKRATGREGSLTCRFTHLYPDGPAPYFTLTCPLDKAKMLDQFEDIKHVALQALVANGGTITHHHAVGRLHRPYYDQQRPELFAKALRAAKRALDPKGMLNPGVLIDPER